MTPNFSQNLIIYTDGGARGNPGPAAIGFVIKDTHDQTLYESAAYIGETTNNVAEYTAVIKALTWLLSAHHSPSHISFLLDSDLVVNQLNGKYKIKQPHLQTLAIEVKKLITQFKAKPTFKYIPRAQNPRADHLLNQVLDQTLH